MGATDLDDAVEILRLLLQRGAQLGDGRQQLVRQGFDRRDMHGRGKHVVAGLAAVDVVVGVDKTPFPALAAQQFAGAVGQHLVDVHVGLGARAGLPDHQRKFVRMLVGQHFVGGSDDGVGLFLVLQTQGRVDLGRRTLDQRQGADDFLGLLFARDVEVVQRTLGLGAPELVCGDLDRAKGVFFDPCRHGWLAFSLDSCVDEARFAPACTGHAGAGT